MISYIIFSAIILLGGFVLMKFENNKLRSSYNYFEKIFKSKTIEDEEEDN